jgi:hypothetical protein
MAPIGPPTSPPARAPLAAPSAVVDCANAALDAISDAAINETARRFLIMFLQFGLNMNFNPGGARWFRFHLT